MKKTFTFQKGKPTKDGFYLLRLKRYKHKLYQTYDIDFFTTKFGWKRWHENEIKEWAKIN